MKSALCPMTLLLCLVSISLLSARDVTFVVGADLHYTQGSSISGYIETINGLPGREYPAEVGGVIGTPEAVLIVGDITNYSTEAEWTSFENDWGLNGDSKSDFKVYEGLGNHDQWDVTNATVRDKIIERNPLREGVSNISDNGLHYSWDWDDIHGVQLNMLVGNSVPSKDRFNPFNSLDFLISDLAENVGTSGRPVVLFHHCDMEMAEEKWPQEDKDGYYEAIKDYNVIGIFYGHTHKTGYYKWNGIDAFNVSSVDLQPNGAFFVVNVNDTMLTVANNQRSNWSEVFQIPLDVKTSNVSLSSSLQQAPRFSVRQAENLSITLPEHIDGTLQLLKSNGQVIASQEVSRNRNLFSMDKPTPGVYVIQFKSNSITMSHSIVISQ